MRLTQKLLTRNECYIAGKTIHPRGVMVHSTGANNPKTSRYTSAWDKPGVLKCVHAFVGYLPEGGIGTVQTLPWNRRGWHCAGRGNDTHIAFEICEDGLADWTYFEFVYQEAVELTAHLCNEYNLDPLADGVVICHQEGFRRGIASNHGDVLHWFPKFGKSMDDFRADVAQEMKGADEMLTYEQWKAYMEQYRKELAAQPATMPELLADAKARGLTDGSRPRDLVTREEAAVMARAAARDT